MKYAGFLPLSTLDFPHHASCVIFTHGCNMRCPYCHNVGAVKETQNVPEDSIYESVRSQRKFLNYAVVSGGEPTIHSDLSDFLSNLKDLGYTIKLDTNGSNPDLLNVLINEQLVDYVAVDIKTRTFKYDSPEYGLWFGAGRRIVETLRILKNTDFNYEFRVPCVHPLINVHTVAECIRYAYGRPIYLQHVRLDNILSPSYFENGYLIPFTENEIAKLASIRVPNLFIR